MTARQLRDAGTLLVPAVTRSVEALKLGPADDALVALCLALAADVDGADADHRPRLYAQLMKALDMLARRSPAASRDRGGESWLDQMRAGRARSERHRL